MRRGLLLPGSRGWKWLLKPGTDNCETDPVPGVPWYREHHDREKDLYPDPETEIGPFGREVLFKCGAKCFLALQGELYNSGLGVRI